MTSAAQPAPGAANTTEIMITAIAAHARGARARGGGRALADSRQRGASGRARARTGACAFRSSAAARTAPSRTARASCSTAPARAASTPSSCRAGRSTAQANINLVGVGDVADYPRGEARFPGSFGSAYLYFVVPRVILFHAGAHARACWCRRWISSARRARARPSVYRPGGPYALVTSLCVFHFDRTRGRFTLASTHPGVSRETVRAATGFDYDEPADGAGHAGAGRGDPAPAAHRHRPHHRRDLSRLCRARRGATRGARS